MSYSRPPKRFAILAGVNTYPSDGSRRGEDGVPVSVNQLYGSVNDVRAVGQFIRDKFQIDRPYVLTAEADGSKKSPKEHPDLLPTYRNIRRHFIKVFGEAQAGDLFLFYFSGHGALLPVIEKSPKDGRTTDPSLLTFDYCRGKRAVRGWELNAWLKALHNKRVQIVAILDSCYSGATWRGDSVFRTPDTWKPPPNLQADEDDTDDDDIIFDEPESVVEPTNRDSKLTQIWGIDPRWFTLMAACKSYELAGEDTVSTSDGMERRGIFTHRLLCQLEQGYSRTPTYRILRDQVDKILKEEHRSQTPQVYGRDRLTFLGNREQFSAASNVVRVQGQQVVIPLGQMHGINTGTEFTTCSPGEIYTIKVDWVDATRCTSEVAPQVARYFEHHSEVTLSRPSLSPPSPNQVAFKVYLDSSLGDMFRFSFRTDLEHRISGRIQYVEGELPHDYLSGTRGSPRSPVHSLGLQAHLEAVKIIGPRSLLGDSGTVGGLRLGEDEAGGSARAAAASVAHLIRFSQILDLRLKACQENTGFSTTITPEPYHHLDNRLGNTWNGISYQDGQKLRYKFNNKSGRDLYITVLTLGPGFHVRQLWPTNHDAVHVGIGNQASFGFSMEIPPELSIGSSMPHRDIIRTVVTDRVGPSFRGIELPDIWDICEEVESAFRNATKVVVHENVVWWIDDTPILTRAS